jgi:hypothetical protein
VADSSACGWPGSVNGQRRLSCLDTQSLRSAVAAGSGVAPPPAPAPMPKPLRRYSSAPMVGAGGRSRSVAALGEIPDLQQALAEALQEEEEEEEGGVGGDGSSLEDDV